MRKAVRVPKIKPLHYKYRTVEKLEVGEKVWVSFDGKVALPARLVEKDDRHYTVKFECRAQGVRPGAQHFFKLDEVRTTPKLACINMVTL